LKLDVYVDNVLTGTLDQVDLTQYVFSYQGGVDPKKMVSLLMPVRTQSWVHRFLHPVFQVSLPEGVLRQLLTKNYSKQFPRFGDTELLAVVGSHLIGRIKIAAHGSPLNVDSPHENLTDLLSYSTQEMIDHYIGEHAQYSGVSGGFPKFLAKSPATGLDSDGKSTLRFDHWIVKANDADRPHLVLNEYFGLSVVKKMGLPTPEFVLSDDGNRLAIKRFDITEAGRHLGFEDMCALMALNAADKFGGSVERIVKILNDFCPAETREVSIGQFYAQYVACMAIRNGDAHLKNFGLLYTNFDDVHLSPAYDMLSMAAYAPRAQNGDALDDPALNFGGVRRWFTEKTIKSFAARCLISSTEQKRVSDRLCAAMQHVAYEICGKAEQMASFRPTARRMLELWSHGLRIHSNEVSNQMIELMQRVEHLDDPDDLMAEQSASP